MARRAPRKPSTKASRSETLGQRLARLRKQRGYTQVELAEKLDTIQAIVSDYERDKLRPHPDMLVRFAKTLEVSTDEILGLDETRAAAAPIVNRRLLRRIRQIDQLPKRDQDALIRTIDAFLGKSRAS